MVTITPNGQRRWSTLRIYRWLRTGSACWSSSLRCSSIRRYSIIAVLPEGFPWGRGDTSEGITGSCLDLCVMKLFYIDYLSYILVAPRLKSPARSIRESLPCVRQEVHRKSQNNCGTKNARSIIPTNACVSGTVPRVYFTSKNLIRPELLRRLIDIRFR